MNKTIVITGASSGIGKICVALFSARGWNVAATMRSPEKETELNKLPNVKLFKLDVLDKSSIELASLNIIAEFGIVTVLVNNAGYAAVGVFEAATDEIIKKQMDTNVVGLMQVTQVFLPHFRTNRKGVIVNIASVGGRVTFPLYSLYHATKWAVEGFSESLAFELRPFNIKVKLIEPGPIKTDFYERSMTVIDKVGLNEYDVYQERCLKNMESTISNASEPVVVAEEIYKAATDNSYKLRYSVGGNAPAMLWLRKMLPDFIFLWIIRKVLERKV